MAGLGFKDFAVGEVLTAADVDGYLMQQSVMRFADSAARGSALGTAVGTGVALAEGMVTYLNDSDALEVYDGSAWTPASKVLQVVESVKTDTASTTSGSMVSSGLSVSITPTSASNSIIVEVYAPVAMTAGAGSRQGLLTVYRDSTDLLTPDTPSSRIPAFHSINSDGLTATNNLMEVAAFSIIDSPATTSATTYALYWKTNVNTLYLNRSVNDTDAAYVPRGVAVIRATEVAA